MAGRGRGFVIKKPEQSQDSDEQVTTESVGSSSVSSFPFLGRGAPCPTITPRAINPFVGRASIFGRGTFTSTSSDTKKSSDSDSKEAPNVADIQTSPKHALHSSGRGRSSGTTYQFE